MAGDARWGAFKTHSRSEVGLPASGKRLLEGGVAGMKKKADTALDKILQDVLKKARDTERKFTQHLAQFAAPAPTANAAVRTGNEDREFRKPVRIFIVDPERGNEVKDARGQYLWDGCPSHSVAIVKVASLVELVDKARPRIPAGRSIRAIYGALANPVPTCTVPDATRLQSDNEVEAFFEVTSSTPIRLQIVLHRNPTAGPMVRDTPPPDHGAYFPVDLFSTPEERNDSAEDSDPLPRGSARMSRRAFPDADFRQQNSRTRKRIKRQKQKNLR